MRRRRTELCYQPSSAHHHFLQCHFPGSLQNSRRKPSLRSFGPTTKPISRSGVNLLRWGEFSGKLVATRENKTEKIKIKELSPIKRYIRVGGKTALWRQISVEKISTKTWDISLRNFLVKISGYRTNNTKTEICLRSRHGSLFGAHYMHRRVVRLLPLGSIQSECY